MTTPVHIQQRRKAISRIPQPDYRTATAAAANAFNEICVSDQNLAQYSVKTQDNQGYSTQNDFPTDQWTLSHDVACPFELDLASDPIGRILYCAFGSITTTQPASGTDPLVYQHYYVPQDPNVSRQLPALSFLEQVGGAINILYPSNIVEQLKMEGAGVNRIKGSFSLRGSGKRITPSGVTWATHVNQVSGWKYFFNSACDLTVADASTLSNAVDYSTTQRMETWSFEYQNQPIGEDANRPGSTDFQTAGDVTSGAIRSECLFGVRTIVPNFVVRADAASDEFSALQAQKPLDWKVILTGPTISHAYKHQLTIHGQLVQYATVQYGQQNGIVTVSVQPKLLWDTSTSKIVEITLINTVSSYTT